MEKINNLTMDQQNELLGILEVRFNNNMNRHPKLEWAKVLEKISKDAAILLTLFNMEETGGQPDLIKLTNVTDQYFFVDCSPESPEGRRNLCYDREALDKRKKNKPQSSVMDVAEEIGIELLTESQYRALQKFGEFDVKTSSWVKTPDTVRKLGGATFCDRRYDTVFFYHNGADSYYAARGFRGCLAIDLF
ncbi:MAG: hypothetical protein PWP30_1801 [Eubacteriaceae bacterium]|nr:hypothetical protein [Eubacteriaceae bacterium]MDK2935226.1 hypothetical protein [Eubacteriaceae bacterium]